MTRLGIIARADEGGLGSQTWEYARHLQPEALMLVSVPDPRGEELARRFTALRPRPLVFRSQFPVDEADDLGVWRMFAEACDVILTAETCYVQQFPAICVAAGTRLVIHANPELWEWSGRPGVTPWAPTDWLLNTLPEGTPVVPMPVDRQRCAPRSVTEVTRLLHVSGPAMLDRNGAKILTKALRLCRSSFELHISGPERPLEGLTVGRIKLYPVAQQRDYWRLYEHGDALILPRRYGGLSLPLQEAASCGLPILSIGVQPQVQWLHPSLALRPKLGTHARMKGGIIPLWRCDPAALAQTIDSLVAGEQLEERCAASEAFAQGIDWAAWEPVYEDMLRG